jgi:hypothetical protein
MLSDHGADMVSEPVACAAQVARETPVSYCQLALKRTVGRRVRHPG